MLASDRAKSFVEGVISVLSKRFNIERVLGSAYHPQAQGAVEGPHRTYKSLCRAFMEDQQDWDLMAPIFQ